MSGSNYDDIVRALGHPPQNADGTPHFTYYDGDHLLSFVWDGVSEKIEVSHGGYGEPVSDQIPIHPIPGAHDTAKGWLEYFQSICITYVALYVERMSR